jgi:hypothetical protein
VLLTAAVAAAVSLYLVLTVPPPAVDLGPAPANVATGAYHVHSERSDGTGSLDDIARAASDAGLTFVILTDHGDGTRPVEPPAYRHGVLVMDAVEINTTAGHLVALGAGRRSPYPIAGHPRDVIEDIHRLGGWAVIAHPDSPSEGLRWRGQNAAADGIEWTNVDAEWRDESPSTLVGTAIRSLVRGPESIATLFSRSRSVARLDALARERPAFGLAALDAHANIAWRDREEPRRRSLVRWPTYRTLFRTVVQAVPLEAPLSGRAPEDADRILDAIRRGRSFSVVRAYAGPAALRFTATQGDRLVDMGGRLGAFGETTFHAEVPEAPGARVTLLLDGRPAASGQGSVRLVAPGRPGAYRVEVTWPGAPAPWIISNPIVIDRPGDSAAPPPTGPAETLAMPMAPDAWAIERAPTSEARLTADGDGVRLAFRLAGGAPSGQYAAIAARVTTGAGVAGVRFEGRASQPMRVSVQLRLPGGADGRRWRRSVYLDETPRTLSISLEEFDPVEPYTSQRPIVSPVQSLLFVVDTLNTLPGADGSFAVSQVALELREP